MIESNEPQGLSRKTQIAIWIVLILGAAAIFAVLRYGVQDIRFNKTFIVLSLSNFKPELGLLTGESVEELQNCHGAYYFPPIHTTTTFGAGNNPDEGYAYVFPWENLYINKDDSLKFGPQTIVIVKGALNYLTTDAFYHCTNRRFHDVYGVPDRITTNAERVAYVHSELSSWESCPPNWDCAQPAKYVIVEDGHVIEAGMVTLIK